jgi:hypothetical protein
MVMGFIASPTSQQHMASGFMLVTMEAMVLESTPRFLRVDAGLLCLDLFQSMLMKIMFVPVVLCSSGTAPESTEQAAVLCSSGTVPELAEHADHMVLLVIAATA